MSWTASQLAQKPSEGAAPHYWTAVRTPQNIAHMGNRKQFQHLCPSCPQSLLDPPPWCCRNGLSANWGQARIKSLLAEVEKGCNVLLLIRNFDLTPPFFICFAVLCLTFICGRQPSNFGDPPFTNKFTRKEHVKSGCISGNLKLCEKIGFLGSHSVTKVLWIVLKQSK